MKRGTIEHVKRAAVVVDTIGTSGMIVAGMTVKYSIFDASTGACADSHLGCHAKRAGLSGCAARIT
jgi:hypothetical protein